jgi:hypothetical protein
MKTTELFVEQVLIGFLVLLVAALVFWVDVYAFAARRSDKSIDVLVTGGVLVGAAYLIGMVYDRIADTLLQDIEGHGRLQFALSPFKLASKKIRTAASRIQDDNDVEVRVFALTDRKDPFEEGRYRIKVLSNGEATGQMDYLRSRLRLTRAMATIIPALTLALLLGLDNGEAGAWWTFAALSIPIVYAATFLSKASRWKLFARPPKTNQHRKVNEYIGRLCMLPNDEEIAWRPSRIIAHDEIWIGLAVLTLVGIVLVLKTGIYELLSVVVVGLALTIVVGWTWWRISMTFYAFVRDFTELNKPKRS